MISEVKKTIDGLDGNGLLKTYTLSMEDKMAAGVFGRALIIMGKKANQVNTKTLYLLLF